MIKQSIPHRQSLQLLVLLSALIGTTQLLAFGKAPEPETKPGVAEASQADNKDTATARALSASEKAFQQRAIAADSDQSNWLLHGRTYSEQRFSPLQSINTNTVSKLGYAWSFATNSTRGLEATPIVKDGVLYVTGTWSVVYALNAKTGELLWSYDPKVPRGWAIKGCCDVVNRGVAVWEDRVFLGTFDGRLVALNATTGELIWDVNTIDRSRPMTITGAPRVVNGKVIIGNGGAEFNVRGYVSAYDAQSGELVWRFYTVPNAPGKPQEHPELEIAAKTWSDKGDWLQTGGGGTVWDSISFDPELNLLYVGTGNGSPHARHKRSPGGGDNLFLSTILALDADSGQMKWYYQTTPADSWDFTATQHMILAELEIDGKPRKVLMQAPKNGFFYVLDRETGELLSAEKFVTVNWASHIENGRPVETGQGDYSQEDKLVFPSELGGHNWHPMSFSPNTGLVYIPALDRGWVHSPTDFYLFNYNPPPHLAELQKGQPVADEGGFLKAWNPVTQKLVWQVKNPAFMNGGILSTAGGLVFQGTEDGYFNAYDATNGQRLLNLFFGTGIIASPISYAIDGEQYIAIMAGFGGASLFMLDPKAAANDYSNEGRLVVLKLGGTPIPQPNKLADGRDSTAPEVTVVPAAVKRGGQLYTRNCGFCHGMFGSKSILPDLTNMPPEINAIFKNIVLDGVFESKGMASFAGALNEQDVADIQTFLNYDTPE